MTTEDAISIAESHHASEMLVGRANTTLRCRIVTALEVVLQHSMMIHFDPLVSRLSERLLFVETFIIRHNQEPGNQLHQFNQQKVDQMKNELSSLQVETHWLPRLSTVTVSCNQLLLSICYIDLPYSTERTLFLSLVF
jgi:hypothetical protein